MGSYVEITLDEFKKEIENEMGFTCVNPNREVSNPSGGYAEEYIYERVVKHHNPDDMMPVAEGTFIYQPPEGHHYDMAKDEEVIVQIMGMGPVITTQIPQPGN